MAIFVQISNLAAAVAGLRVTREIGRNLANLYSSSAAL